MLVLFSYKSRPKLQFHFLIYKHRHFISNICFSPLFLQRALSLWYLQDSPHHPAPLHLLSTVWAGPQQSLFITVHPWVSPGTLLWIWILFTWRSRVPVSLRLALPGAGILAAHSSSSFVWLANYWIAPFFVVFVCLFVLSLILKTNPYTCGQWGHGCVCQSPVSLSPSFLLSVRGPSLLPGQPPTQRTAQGRQPRFGCGHDVSVVGFWISITFLFSLQFSLHSFL